MLFLNPVMQSSEESALSQLGTTISQNVDDRVAWNLLNLIYMWHAASIGHLRQLSSLFAYWSDSFL